MNCRIETASFLRRRLSFVEINFCLLPREQMACTAFVPLKIPRAFHGVLRGRTNHSFEISTIVYNF